MQAKLEAKILNLPVVNIAYQRHIGPYGPGIAKFWRDTFMPWCVANRVATHATFGIAHDDPQQTAPEKCRYDAGVEVARDFKASEPTYLTTLPGGYYAVAEFSGPASEIGAAWSALFREWLPANGWQVDNRPCFERYLPDTKFDAKTGAFECELCISVRPL